MATVEEQAAATSHKVVDVEKQIEALLVGITQASARTEQVAALADKAVITANKAIEAMEKTTRECQELRITTEKILLKTACWYPSLMWRNLWRDLVHASIIWKVPHQ
jgi:hypothetical protein